MNVILNVESLTPPITGIGHYTQELLKGLQARQDIDRIHCFANFSWVNPFQYGGQKVGAESGISRRSRWVALRATVRRLPMAYRLRSSLRNYFFQRTVRTLGNAIYHEPNYVLKPFDGPTVVTVHDLSHIHYPQYHPVERVNYLDRELPRTLQRAGQVITDSEFVRKELIAIFGLSPERVAAIPLGKGSQFFPRQEQEIHPLLQRYGLRYGQYLLTVSTLEPRKNLASLLDAYVRLPRQVRKLFPLVLVGAQGWHYRTLEDTIARLETKGEARRLGYLPAVELPLLYAGAGAFAFPSIYEGFGLPPLEAMASGVPVMTSNTSAMPEVAGQACLLVDPLDADSIFRGLERLLLDETFRNTARTDGPDRAALFSWENCVENTVDVYKRITG